MRIITPELLRPYNLLVIAAVVILVRLLMFKVTSSLNLGGTAPAGAP